MVEVDGGEDGEGSVEDVGVSGRHGGGCRHLAQVSELDVELEVGGLERLGQGGVFWRRSGWMKRSSCSPWATSSAPSASTAAASRDIVTASAGSVLPASTVRSNRRAVLARVGGRWKGLDDLDVETCAWVSWFNSERIHAELGNITPTEVEDDHYAANPQTLVA